MKMSPETKEKIRAAMPKQYTRTVKRPPIDWSRPVKDVAAELGISIARAYALRKSFRKPKPDLDALPKWVRPEAELRWLLETLNRATRVRNAALKEFGPVLRRWRKSKKWTQNELAERTGRARQSKAGIVYVCAMETGSNVPPESFIETLMELLSVEETEVRP